MSCGCGNLPCSPAPFRCECEKNCWVGPPGDYDTCLEACDDCDFPQYPGHPTEGYGCPDGEGTEEDYATCLDDCASALAAATAICAGLSDAAKCACDEAALEADNACHYNCERDALPGRVACAQGDVTADKTCCNTVLAMCYEPCENAYLEAIQPSEENFYDCEEAAYAAYYDSMYWEPDPGACGPIYGADQALFYALLACKRARASARLPHLQTRRICRAACERDEMRRDTPADRKRPECGGRLHYCEETCAADFMFARAECIDALNGCFLACAPDDSGDGCREECNNDYTDCYAGKFVENVDCRFACCVQEHAHPPNLRLYDPCHLACWTPAFSALVSCAKDHLECVNACAGDSGCIAGCDATRATCEDDARDDFEDCLDPDCLALLKDCPNCAELAIAGACDDGTSSTATDDEGSSSLPPPPACE